MSFVNECFFEYGQRWPDLRPYIERITNSSDGANRDALDIILEAMETRDQDIEDHLNNRPCGGGGCVQSWAFSGNANVQGDWSIVESVTLSEAASLIVNITTALNGLNPGLKPSVDGFVNWLLPYSNESLTYAASLDAGTYDIGFANTTFDGESGGCAWSMTIIATCSGTTNLVANP